MGVLASWCDSALNPVTTQESTSCVPSFFSIGRISPPRRAGSRSTRKWATGATITLQVDRRRRSVSTEKAKIKSKEAGAATSVPAWDERRPARHARVTLGALLVQCR